MSLLDLVNLHFRCAITMQRPNMPMVCPCGHLFEATAIYEWLTVRNTCPVSRLQLTPAELRFDSVINQFLGAINREDEPTIEMETQTTSVDTTADARSESTLDAGTQTSQHAPLIQPFVYLGNEHKAAMELPENERRYLANDLLVDLGVATFNPSSSNLRLEPVLNHLNHAYIRNRIPYACNNPHIVVRKYCYQHTSDSLVEVAKSLARSGYYVYDLFNIGKTNGLNRYVLYSADVKDDGSNNNLSKFRTISNRLI